MYLDGEELLTKLRIRDFQLPELVASGLIPYDRFGKDTVRDEIRNRLILHIAMIDDYLGRKERFPEELDLANRERDAVLQLLLDIRDNGWRAFHLPDLVVNQLNEEIVKLLVSAIYKSADVADISVKMERLNLDEHLNDPAPADEGALDRMPFPCDPGTTWRQVTFVLKSDDLVYVKTPKGEARVHYSQLGFADARKGDAPREAIWPLFQALARMGGEIFLEGGEYIRNFPDRAYRLKTLLMRTIGIDQSIWVGNYKKTKSYKAAFNIRDERSS